MSADYARCAELIAQADGLLITAGAGMGVDSGLPPRLAWGFYGHCLNLYRATIPHAGFHILRQIGEKMPSGCFVFTSNVDGQFLKAGFERRRINECHGSIHHLQCLAGCTGEIWAANDYRPEIDEEHGLLTSDFPKCPHCEGMARPNILMFGDWGWLEQRSAEQNRRMSDWLRRVERLLVIEIGAGTNIPTVRLMGESLPGRLIRINPSEPDLDEEKGVSIASGGLEALCGIESALSRLS